MHLPMRLFGLLLLSLTPATLSQALPETQQRGPSNRPNEIGTLHAPDAIVISVTEPDLNRMVQGTLHSHGGPVFEGVSHNPSRGLYDLRYRVDISNPVLKLGNNGEASINFSIREANVQVGRYQRKIGKEIASCENLGLTVDPGQPVSVALGFHLAINDGDLELIPDTVSIPDAAKRFHLVKPTHCENTIVPRWLLWMIGKPRLKRRLGDLDGVLLASVKKSALRLNEDGGLFGERLGFGVQNTHGRNGDTGPSTNRKNDLYLHPGLIDTSRGALSLSLTASDSSHAEAPTTTPPWASSLSDRSFLAVSESFLNALSRRTFSQFASIPRKPSGNFRKLLKSDSLFALIPGLRGIDHREKLYFTIQVHEAPRVELRSSLKENATLPDLSARAMIAIHVTGMEVKVWKTEESGETLLGTLQIDSGHIGITPYASALGGVSFEIKENEWKVSSSGIEFNDELFAATIQELIFGEAFETHYAPLLRGGLGVGDARLLPQAVRVVGDHLVVEFAGLTPL